MVRERKGDERRNRHAPKPPPTLSNGRHIACPEQKGVEGVRGIPVTEYHFHGGPRAFRKMMRRRWLRARKIAPLVIGRCQVPVTPLLNPVTGRSSYHIIRLIDKWKPTYAVDLLFQDTNSYLAAFRRLRLANDGTWTGGTWFRYSDMVNLPPEIMKDAVNLIFDSSHGDGSFKRATDIGGISMMFEVLSSCEDYERHHKTRELLNKSDISRVEGVLHKAIVMFSEAFRFRCVYLAMLRTEDGKDTREAYDCMWKVIHKWDHMSGQVLGLWSKDLPPMHTQAPEWFKNLRVTRSGYQDPVVLKTLEEIIGEEGELLLVNGQCNLVVSDAMYKQWRSWRILTSRPLSKRLYHST